MKFIRAGVYPSTGAVRLSSHLPCNSNSHQPCAEQKVKIILSKLYPLVHRREGAYYQFVDVDLFKSSLLSDRFYRKRQSPDDFYLWVRRENGIRIISSHNLPGRLPPQEMVRLPEEVLMPVAGEALHLPGMIAHHWSHFDNPPTDRHERPVDLGRATRPTWDVVFERALELAMIRHGTTPIVVKGSLVQPSLISGEEWARCLVDSVLSLRGDP